MINALISLILGAFTAMGFLYPPYQYLIATSFLLFVLLLKKIEAKDIGLFFTSLHVTGSSWLMVPIHVIGGLNYFLTCLIILFLGSCYGLLYAFAFQCLKLFNRGNHFFFIMGILPVSIIISEYLKLNLLGGYPFLLYGYALVNTPFAQLIPILGIYGSSWVFLVLCCLLAYLIRNKLIIYTFIYILIISLTVNIIQPAHWTKNNGKLKIVLTHTDKHYINNDIEEKNIELPRQKADVVVYPEGMITPRTKELPSVNTYSVLGMMQYNTQKNGWYNIMIGVNAKGVVDYIHKKHHLAQFNEWIPSSIKIILAKLKLPHRGLLRGNTHDTNGMIKGIPFTGLICYELMFSDYIFTHLHNSQIIIANNDLGWFEKSSFDNQFIHASQFMAILTAKPIVLSSNIGKSVYIDGFGMIKDTVNNNTEQSKLVFVETQTGKTPWQYYGNHFILQIIIGLFLMAYLILIKSNLKLLKK